MKFESLRDLRMKGFPKFLHGCVMFITYPIRHPFKFLLFLAVLIIIGLLALPLSQKVAVKDMPGWYKVQYEEVWLPKLKTFKIKDITKNLSWSKTKNKGFAKPVVISHVETSSNTETKRETHRDSLTSSINKPQKYEVWNIQKKSDERNNVKKSPRVFAKPAMQPKIVQVQPRRVVDEKIPELSYKKIDGLSYLDKPRLVEGAAIVYGPNELYVSDTYMYLYGIYTDEYKYDVRVAGDYLRKLVENKGIKCYVVAETKDYISTSICFSGNQNINQKMVDAHMADDVALSEAEK